MYFSEHIGTLDSADFDTVAYSLYKMKMGGRLHVLVIMVSPG